MFLIFILCLMCYSLQKGAKYYIIKKQILAEELIQVPALYQLHPKASVEEPAAVCAGNTERQEQGASGVVLLLPQL